MWVIAEKSTSPLVAGSAGEFIFEHYHGYTRAGAGTTFEYQVEHIRWCVHPVTDYGIDFDFHGLYGEQCAALSRQSPCSVFLAEGSGVTVGAKRVLQKKRGV